MAFIIFNMLSCLLVLIIFFVKPSFMESFNNTFTYTEMSLTPETTLDYGENVTIRTTPSIVNASLHVKEIVVSGQNKITPEPYVTQIEPDVTKPDLYVINSEPNMAQSEPNIKLEPNFIKPKPNMTKLGPNLTKSEPNVTTQDPIVAKPEPNLTQPEPDVTKPELNVISSEPNVAQSEPNIIKLEPNMTLEPILDKPKPNEINPVPNGTIPVPIMAKPEPNVINPEPNMTKPEANLTKLEQNMNTPESNVTKPEPNMTKLEPNATTSQPNVTLPEQNVSIPEPNVTIPEPNVTTPELNVTKLEPNFTSPQPNVTRPEQNVSIPEPNVTTPEPSAATPELNVTTPAPTECICGISAVNDDNFGQRIIGGRTAKPHAYPWHAVLQYYKKSVCSGTLINYQYILTAAHCLLMLRDFQRRLEFKFRHIIIPRKNVTIILHKISIVLGAYINSNEFNEKIVGVDSYYIHPDHRMDSVHDVNDIALIKLDQPVNYTANVYPVCLPNQGEDFSGHLGIIVGWSKTYINGAAFKFLRHASVHILADPICVRSRIGSHFNESPESMICAYKFQIDACQGDSGGPLLYKRTSGSYFQIGITSWGIDCAKVGYPGVYTEVAAYVDWIEKHTKGSVFCSKPKD